MKVLHLSTYNTKCGIADYLRYLLSEFEKIDEYHDVYPINMDVQKKREYNEAIEYYEEFIKKAQKYDIIHIQHEFGTFTGDYPIWKSFKLFNYILEGIKDKRVFVTFHSPPILLLHNKISNKIFKSYSFVKYFQKDNNFIGLVHNNINLNQYLQAGFSPKSIKQIFHPTPNLIKNQMINKELSDAVTKKLNLDKDSKVLSITGFINNSLEGRNILMRLLLTLLSSSGFSLKGQDIGIKILNQLPENYKFILLGGKHPHGNSIYYDKIVEYINENSLNDRVLITGFYDEKDLATYAELIDIFLAPYSNSFTASSGAINVNIQCKKPIIAFDIESFKEINNEFEPLVLVKDENSMKEKILEFEKDGSLNNYYISQEELYLKNNSYEKLAKLQLEMYKSLMNH
ncbi:MAG: glycosyltransferase [Methanobrevibacter sp.]|jgi:hypothetical protein|nr:glycosyltransferase [Candidatus Methanovirga australis]